MANASQKLGQLALWTLKMDRKLRNRFDKAIAKNDTALTEAATAMRVEEETLTAWRDFTLAIG